MSKFTLKVAQSAHQQQVGNNDDMSFFYQAAKFLDFGTEDMSTSIE